MLVGFSLVNNFQLRSMAQERWCNNGAQPTSLGRFELRRHGLLRDTLYTAEYGLEVSGDEGHKAVWVGPLTLIKQ